MLLKIKRVPSLVSNYQKEEAEGSGCGRNCLGKCCMQGMKLPLYTFKAMNKMVRGNEMIADEKTESPVAFLDSLLLGEWEDRMQRGLFRYDVTACETKVSGDRICDPRVAGCSNFNFSPMGAQFFLLTSLQVIPGEYGFIAQLNEGRHLKKRPTEFRVDKVLQNFDEKRFNFTKVGQEEVLFQLERSEDDEANFFPYAPIDIHHSPSVVAINVSPIEYGHVLLIPRIFECLPQRIDQESFLLALHMAVEADNPYFRLGYNSLGAFATINHLHFQAYYLAMTFPIEMTPSRKITTFHGCVKISELLNYPVRGLVFEGGNTLLDLSNAVSASCICLQDNNIPYNVLICDSGRRVFLFPQCYAEKQALGKVSTELLETQVNPAVWEISGHMVLKRRQDYEEASEENAWKLLAEVSLSEERFQEVKDLILETVGCKDSENGDLNLKMADEDDDGSPQHPSEIDTMKKGNYTRMVPGQQKCVVLQ